ncbi:MAG: HEAT repeat domain-containing protein [Actinomycetota bacterium]|nr:HEAT repeat domain-containing protein [Actinomycetota bacterium]
MGFIPELDGLSFEELAACFDGPPIDDLADAPWVFYQEVAMLLRERNPDRAAAFLESRANSTEADPGRLTGALLGLSHRGPSDHAYRPLFVKNLSHPHDIVVQEAIDSLAQIQAAEEAGAVAELADHRSPYIRGAVLRYWMWVFGPDARPRLLAGFDDPDPTVRFWALDALDDLGEQADDRVIERSAHDSDPDVAAHARLIAELRAEYS